MRLLGRPRSIRLPRWPCQCCYALSDHAPAKRRAKRREQRQWRKDAGL